MGMVTAAFTLGGLVVIGWLLGVAATWLGFRLARSAVGEAMLLPLIDEDDDEGGWDGGPDEAGGPDLPDAPPVILGHYTGNGRA